jgi:hypothetical protein
VIQTKRGRSGCQEPKVHISRNRCHQHLRLSARPRVGHQEFRPTIVLGSEDCLILDVIPGALQRLCWTQQYFTDQAGLRITVRS